MWICAALGNADLNMWDGKSLALKQHFSDEVSTQVGEPWNELLAMLSDETLRHRHPESKTYFPLGGLLMTADR